MSRAVGAGSYRAVLVLPFALRTFVPAIGGRLAYGVFPLATLYCARPGRRWPPSTWLPTWPPMSWVEGRSSVVSGLHGRNSSAVDHILGTHD